jgi:hypothetical protein
MFSKSAGISNRYLRISPEFREKLNKFLLFMVIFFGDVVVFMAISHLTVFDAAEPAKPPRFVLQVSPHLVEPPPPPSVSSSDVPNIDNDADLPNAAPVGLITLSTPRFVFNAPKVTLTHLPPPKALMLALVKSRGHGYGWHKGSGKIMEVNGGAALQIAASLHSSRMGIIFDASASMMIADFDTFQASPKGTVAENIIRSLRFNRLELASSCSIIGKGEKPEAGSVLERADITSLPGFRPESTYPTDINRALLALKEHGDYDTILLLTDLQDEESAPGLAKLEKTLDGSRLIIFSFDQPGSPELLRIVRDSGGEIYQVQVESSLAAAGE